VTAGFSIFPRIHRGFLGIFVSAIFIMYFLSQWLIRILSQDCNSSSQRLVDSYDAATPEEQQQLRPLMRRKG
jgi:hypothetical protein